MIANAAQLRELLPQLETVVRVAIDTEADSLHCYREKLCLLQISVPGRDAIVDPLADVDLAPLNAALADKEIVLHGADYDLRLLRRNMNFVPQQIFDTVIAFDDLMRHSDNRAGYLLRLHDDFAGFLGFHGYARRHKKTFRRNVAGR